VLEQLRGVPRCGTTEVRGCNKGDGDSSHQQKNPGE
jgi:hypothetical protein